MRPFRPDRLWLALLLAVPGAYAAESPRRALADGQRAYERQDFEQAAGQFEKAAQGATAEGLDPAVAHLDHGNALYRAGKFAEAYEAYARARRTTDLRLQARALYNAGTCRLAQAEQALQMQQGQYVEPYLAEAEGLFGQALLLDPDDGDVKRNCEIASVRRGQILAAVANLQAILAQAEEQLGRFAFKEAHRTLTDAQPLVAVALALQRPESKRFQDMATRVAQVVGIAEAPVEGTPP